MKKLLSIIAAGTLMSSTAASVVACDKPSEKDDAQPASDEKPTVDSTNMFVSPGMAWSETLGGLISPKWEFNISSLGVEITKENIKYEIIKYFLDSLNPTLQEAMKNEDFLNQEDFDNKMTLKQWVVKNTISFVTNYWIDIFFKNPGDSSKVYFMSKFYVKDYSLGDQLITVHLNNPIFYFEIWNR
ncbi:hypothetical protein SCLARK_00524 [Spiroplasma clarkii]|uniref:Lipoprotein n=1 Tax=Spiroplasma clarkii TaxID=2139 RepID=A0A1Y0KZM8_9MOLU|nr:lipoprotein [Spiroplasma clarkii]ARU91212.1 hypothetical protein SCLARK_00524 [Spiroplasma clarkii]ATX70652.1 hypothetical protein SCLAR_v1c03220 [Spiroplasma clarkii]